MSDNVDKKAARAERAEARRAKYAGGSSATAEMTDAEREEAEQAEKARQQGGGMFDGPAPGKANQFGPSFKRMIGLLKPCLLYTSPSPRDRG